MAFRHERQLHSHCYRIDGRSRASKVASAKYRTQHSVWRAAGRETSLSARENKDLIRRYFEAIDRPNASPDILDEFLDPEIVAHDPVPGFSGDLGGAEEIVHDVPEIDPRLSHGGRPDRRRRQG